MPALNFTLQSKIDKVSSGECSQTIRPKGKRIYRINDPLYLFKNQRTKHCRRLGESVCLKVIPVNFRLTDLFFDGSTICFSAIHPNTNYNWPLEWQDRLAKDDGFDSWNELSEFFIKTYKMKIDDNKPFEIIKWRDFKKESKA